MEHIHWVYCRFLANAKRRIICEWKLTISWVHYTKHGRRSWVGRVGNYPPAYLLALYWRGTFTHPLSCLLECSSVLPTHSEVAFYASTKKDMVNSVVSFSDGGAVLLDGSFYKRNVCTKLMVNRGGVSFSNRRVKMLPLWAWLVLCNRCKFSITNAPSTTNILIIIGDLKHFPLTQSILLWFSKMFFG